MRGGVILPDHLGRATRRHSSGLVGRAAEPAHGGQWAIYAFGTIWIADVASVLRQDYRSDAGLGMGLWGAGRLMDEITVDSGAGQGDHGHDEEMVARSTRSDSFWMTDAIIEIDH